MLSASMSKVNATAHLAPFGQGGGLAISLRSAGMRTSSRASSVLLTKFAALAPLAGRLRAVASALIAVPLSRSRSRPCASATPRARRGEPRWVVGRSQQSSTFVLTSLLEGAVTINCFRAPQILTGRGAGSTRTHGVQGLGAPAPQCYSACHLRSTGGTHE